LSASSLFQAIEVGDLDQKIRIAEELDGNIIRCIDDQNANHVVQKCIECMPQQHISFIYQNMYGHVVELSAHQYGCRVIQRVLEYCNHPSIQKNILSEIMEQIYWLAKDQYGNYVVQVSHTLYYVLVLYIIINQSLTAAWRSAFAVCNYKAIRTGIRQSSLEEHLA
ncbi:hypothetical protein EJB05_00932, partial [Eragrostis curvula]